MPTYGTDAAIRGLNLRSPPMGWATIIPGGNIGVDKIDLFVTGWREPTHTLEAKIGTERVEDGSVITDHVVAMPAKLRLTGMVSDMAMGADAPGRAWGEVRRLYEAEEILEVITEWGMYKEMVIKTATTTQTGRGMEFMLELQQIVRVGISETSEAAGIPGNPAGDRQLETDAGAKDLVQAPITPLGGGRFRVGSATDPDAPVVRVNEDGSIVNDETGEIIRYRTIPPAEE